MGGWEAPWHWVVLAIIVIALFGYKKLPDAARSVGRSLRIFKTEIKGMTEDDKKREAEAPKEITSLTADPAQQPVHPVAQQPVTPGTVPVAQPVATPVAQPVAQPPVNVNGAQPVVQPEHQPAPQPVAPQRQSGD